MRKRIESGQALVEYALMTLVAAGLVTLLFALMPRALNQMEAPLKSGFPLAYKYGDPKACGYEDTIPPCGGAPDRHPRYIGGGFRLFSRK